MVFSLVAVTAMLIFCTLENRNHCFVLAFAGTCGLGSIYGFLQGTLTFGVVESKWAGVAAKRWRAISN